MQKYWDSQAAPVCVMQKTHGEEPSSWFISVIFQCMKKGLRPNGYFPLTRQPPQKIYNALILTQSRLFSGREFSPLPPASCRKR